MIRQITPRGATYVYRAMDVVEDHGTHVHLRQAAELVPQTTTIYSAEGVAQEVVSFAAVAWRDVRIAVSELGEIDPRSPGAKEAAEMYMRAFPNAVLNA